MFVYKEAILMISDVFLLSTRPGRPISGITGETRPDTRFDIESTDISVPSWIEGAQDDEEQLWQKSLLLNETILCFAPKLTACASAVMML